MRRGRVGLVGSLLAIGASSVATGASLLGWARFLRNGAGASPWPRP